MSEDKMREPVVTINWCAEDVKSVRPKWSDKKCLEAIDSVGKYLHDRSIEEGWQILEVLLDMEYDS